MRAAVVVAGVLAAPSAALHQTTTTSSSTSRRGFFSQAGAAAAAAALTTTTPAQATTDEWRPPLESTMQMPALETPLDTAVELGALRTSRPYVLSAGRLVAIPARDAVGMLTAAQTIWLGEHHDDDARDMQAGIVAAVAVAKAAKSPRAPCLGVGLEAVRAEYQDALDAFVAGDVDLKALSEATNWDAHWPYPVQSYAAVLDLCRELKLPLLALGASSPEIDVVERRGLAALDRDAWQRLSLPEGPATLASFRSSAGSFGGDETSPVLPVSGDKDDSSFANHYCGRLVWDESMAARAAAWVDARRDFDPTLVVLAGADHVAFGCGAPARCARRLPPVDGRAPARSVLLNPRTDDLRAAVGGASGGLTFASSSSSSPPAPVQTTGESLPAADLVWFSPWTEEII